jgi:hypothetical protein
LHLLDRQLLDCNGEMLGKADDIELTDTPHGLTVTAVLTGPAALLDRLGGRLGATLTGRCGSPNPTAPCRGASTSPRSSASTVPSTSRCLARGCCDATTWSIGWASSRAWRSS